MEELLCFRELYERYAPNVRRFALALTGSPALADDLTQETFVRVWTAGTDLRTETIKAYLFTIVRNLNHNTRRREARHVELDPGLVDPANLPDAVAEQRCEVARVIAALAQLSEDERAALALRAFEDLSYAEIATTLGCSLSAAKVRVHRARVKLGRLSAEPIPIPKERIS